MNWEKQLRKYAQVILKVGLNIQPGDKIALDVSEEMIPLVRILAREAYKMGAFHVRMSFSDDEITLSRYEEAPQEALSYFPAFEVQATTQAFDDGYHRLALYAPNPELLKDVDPQKISLVQKTQAAAMKPVMDYVTQNRVKWCVASVPSKAWASSVFPELPEGEALERLWESVFEATRVQEEDPLQAWKDHDSKLKKYQTLLNDASFKKLIFKAPGTDLEVELVEGHAWLGGSGVTPAGESFMANIPTEEIFTMPHAYRVNGRVMASMPLSTQGRLIENFWFELRDGKVVDFDASEGREILEEMLKIDEGASRFGEVALVSDDSPISNTGILFKNTLFDENASCHFALGSAYSENLPGSETFNAEKMREVGMNDSMIHVDFMVGGPELQVSGVKSDGAEVPILVDGNWALEIE